MEEHLIDIVDIKNAIVTTDAMGCQKKIVSKIIEKKGDYVLQLKGNQNALYEEIKAYQNRLLRTNYEDIDVYEEVDKGHGRLEVRKYTQYPITDWVSQKDDWEKLTTFVMVERTREDRCALHSGSGPINMGILKRFCMNLLSKDSTIKRMKHRVMASAVDDSFRERVLFG